MGGEVSPPVAVKPGHRLEARALLYRSLPDGMLGDLPTEVVESMVTHLAGVIASGQVACVKVTGEGPWSTLRYTPTTSPKDSP
jgi:hypothetical protein